MIISTATQYPDDVPSSHMLPSPAPPYVPPLHLTDSAPASRAGSPISLPYLQRCTVCIIHALDPYQFIWNSHTVCGKQDRSTQVSMSGYVTPGSSQSNSSSLLYPGPVYGTSFVPSPLTRVRLVSRHLMMYLPSLWVRTRPGKSASALAQADR
jgi:hypothetical protein